MLLCLQDNTPAGDFAAVGDRWTVLQARQDQLNSLFTVADPATIAADGNDEITVVDRQLYRLTAGDTIDGVIGLAAGQSCGVYTAVGDSVTLSDNASVTAGVAIANGGVDLEILAADEGIYTLTNVGGKIRVAGGAGSAFARRYIRKFDDRSELNATELLEHDVVKMLGYDAIADGGGQELIFTQTQGVFGTPTLDDRDWETNFLI